jgi:glycosyltransferase involved in cell wall biosynthesis
MRIAIVINTSWNIYNFRKGLIKELLKQGHQVVAIAPPDKYSPLLKELGCNFIPVKLDNKGVNPFKDLIFFLHIFRIYRFLKPDVIFHYTIKPNVYGTLAATLRGIPSINNVSGLGTVFLRKNWASNVAFFLYRLTFNYPKKVFFQNYHDRDLFVKQKLVQASVTDILPGSGIDLDHFKPVTFNRNKHFTFLVVARLLYDKGIIEFAEAARKIKSQGHQATFQLLGFLDTSEGGVKPHELDTWIKEGIVEFLGQTDDVRPAMGAADCIVLPSYREGTPRSLLEAGGLGKPIIATNVPGCTEVVTEGLNGFLCNPRDAGDLADKMLKMMFLSDDKLAQMGRKSRSEVEKKFDEKEVIQKYQQALQEIFGSPASSFSRRIPIMEE